jgi:hypothetical protein
VVTFSINDLNGRVSWCYQIYEEALVAKHVTIKALKEWEISNVLDCFENPVVLKIVQV